LDILITSPAQRFLPSNIAIAANLYYPNILASMVTAYIAII
jgi:hypothetical protein